VAQQLVKLIAYIGITFELARVPRVLWGW